MGKFNTLKKMFQVGEKVFPASNAAEAMKIKHALEQSGQVAMNRTLVDLGENAPVDKLRKTINMGNVNFDTAHDGLDTVIKLPNNKAVNVTSDKGDSLQMAQDLIYGRKPIIGSNSVSNVQDAAGAMERSLEPTNVGVTTSGLKKIAGGMAGAGLGMSAMGNANASVPTESSTSPFQLLKQGMGLYKEKVVDPIANKAKEVLTPDMNVQGATYKTASPVTDTIIEGASDPINYIPGVGGAVAGAAQVIGDLTPEDEKFKNTKRLFGR